MNRNKYSILALVLIIIIGLTVSLASPSLSLATPASGGCWYYKADMPASRRGMTAVELNNQIYVLGGQNGQNLNLVQRYDPAGPFGGTWENLQPMPTARSWLVSAVASPEVGKPRVYAIGGSALPTKYATVEMYDPGSNTWLTKAPMKSARFGAAAGVVDNKIYVIGGWRASALSDVEVYDPVTDTWTDKAPLPEPVAMAGAAEVDGKIYVIGGINDTEVLSTVYEYDPATNSWSQKPDMPVPSPDITIPGRNRLASVAVGDKIYVIGGINPQNRWLDTVQSFEPATGNWTTMNWMPNERGEIAAVNVDSTVYVFGGRRSWDSAVVDYTQALNVDCSNNPPEKPSDPNPIPGWNNQPVDLSLNWSGGDLDGEVTYDVYFSESITPTQRTTPPLVSSNQVLTTYEPPETLKPFTKYYWRIVAQDDTGAVTSGDLWGFWTGSGPIIDVDKQAYPEYLPDTGGTVTYTVNITNIGEDAVTLLSLLDSVYGDVTNQVNPSLDSTTCATTQALDPDESYDCYFTSFETGSIGDVLTDTVTASVENAQGIEAKAQDTASVEVISNEPNIRVTKSASVDSLPETGGTVVFGVKVQNISFAPLTLTELNDDMFGDLETWEDSDCELPVPLTTFESYECSFSAFISGNAGMVHVNTVTATATYDGDNSIARTGSAEVAFTDEQPMANLSKWGNPTTLPEPGGEVDYIVTVENTGEETIYLASLQDDVFGDLNGQGDCAITETGPVLEAGQAYECTFTKTLSGLEGESHTNVVTAAVYDDENNIIYRSDDFTVRFVEELPTIYIWLPFIPVSP